MRLCWMAFVCLFYFFQNIGEVAFISITRRHYNPYRLRNFLDVWIFFVFLVYIFNTLARNLGNTIADGPGVVTWDEKAPIYCRNYTTNWLNEMNLLIVGVVSLWIRVMDFTKYNEYLGRFLGVVKKMLAEIALFFTLYLINIVAFSVFAEVAFTNTEENIKLRQAAVENGGL